MKKLFFALLVVVALVGCGENPSCPACGDKGKPEELCPVCGIAVCEYCADEEFIFEEYYESGEMVRYLEERGYVIFDEECSAYELYMFGFATGYEKGNSGVWDDEVEESFDFDYDYLRDKYSGCM